MHIGESIRIGDDVLITVTKATSEEALVHIGIAICVYLILAFIKLQSGLTKSMQQILRLLQLNLFEKRDLMALLRGDPIHNNELNINQLALI